MIIHAHVLARDEAEIFLYSARHYTSFCDRVWLHDMGSTDGTLDIAEQFGIGVRWWDTKDRVDDRVNMRVKDTCWRLVRSDWVLIADADELIYFPKGVEETLSAYDSQNIAIAKPYGYEMFSETMPTTAGQIYDEIKQGAPDNTWYSKPVIISPNRVKSVTFAPGAHQVEAELRDGTRLPNPERFSEPPCYLLHYHQIGPIERIAAKYDRTRSRMCENNVKMNWGNVHKPGLVHAKEKRDYILPRLRQVIP